MSFTVLMRLLSNGSVFEFKLSETWKCKTFLKTNILRNSDCVLIQLNSKTVFVDMWLFIKSFTLTAQNCRAT